MLNWHELKSAIIASRAIKCVLLLLFVGGLALGTASWYAIKPLPDQLIPTGIIEKPQLLDRRGNPLSITYRNRWNFTDGVGLDQVPKFMRELFVLSEDRRFFSHSGVDWIARAHAVWQNLMALKAVRGASTISEQVVRIIHPRPRTVWSRWIEGWEARNLERQFSKLQILEFYINQVPYARNLRGVVQAARYYFDRDLSTLSQKEILLLVALVRAPHRLDPFVAPGAAAQPISRLAQIAKLHGLLNSDELQIINDKGLSFAKPSLPVRAEHFVQWVMSHSPNSDAGRISTTLDSSIQSLAQELIDARVKDLAYRQVSDGAILLVDHTTGEILSWVNAGSPSPLIPTSQIDAVITPRQPGSTLKPFVYALALSKGWNAATLIDDAPISHKVGRGLHLYRNYSRVNYGPVRLRNALGNSLNIPAVKAAMFTGKAPLLNLLHDFGFSLSAHPEFYGEGLALGNGEVSLFELVRAYAALSERGIWRPLRFQLQGTRAEERKVLSPEVASIITDILADPEARQLEFGGSDLLRFPTETAIKTGTSTDYTDAWAVGFNSRYVAGVWIGNLNRKPMREVSGASGPSLVLRSLFAELDKRSENQPLYRSPDLIERQVCAISGQLAQDGCPAVSEWFTASAVPGELCRHNHATEHAKQRESDSSKLKILLPTPGLELALDPRIPDSLERFPFRTNLSADSEVEWILNGRSIGTSAGDLLWHPSRGEFEVVARVDQLGHTSESQKIRFIVK